MSEPTQRVAADCPSCSPDAPTAHEVLSPGGQATVRCTECGHVHKTTVPEETTVERRVIVSQEEESFEARVDAPPDERVTVGEEFLVETDEGFFEVRITSLEPTEGGRTDEAVVEDVDTFWTRAVGNVSVNLTLHPKDGRRESSRSLKIQVPGDETFTIGESREYGDEEFTVEGIVIREDAEGYRRRTFDYEGDRAVAKDITRLYARDESTTAWSAW